MEYPFSGILVRYVARAGHAADAALAEIVEPTAALQGAAAHAPPGASNAEELLDELHVNLWEVREKASKRQRKTSALDLGVMISDWEAVEAVLGK